MVVGQGTSASVVKIEDQGGLPKDLDTAEPLGESSLKKNNGKEDGKVNGTWDHIRVYSLELEGQGVFVNELIVGKRVETATGCKVYLG